MWAFQRGQRESFDRLGPMIWKRAARRAARMRLGADDCDEIAQQVLVRVFLYAADAHFDTEEKFWGWVGAITTHEVYKLWRKRQPEVVDPEVLEFRSPPAAGPRADPPAAAATAEMLADLSDCIGRLDEARQEAMLAIHVAELTFRGAAGASGLTLGQFKHRYEKARAAVADCMRRKGHEVE